MGITFDDPELASAAKIGRQDAVILNLDLRMK